MKKKYMVPTMTLVQLQHSSLICLSITGTESNVGITGGTQGSSEAARVKENGYNVWDDDWSK